MSSLDLASRMQNLRDKHDTQVTSEDRTSTPLWVVLYIYNNARHECYIDYMEGAKLLIKYLSPLKVPPIPDTDLPLPKVLLHYELTELAQLLVPKAVREGNLGAIRTAELVIIQETLKLAQREIV